MNLLLNRWGRLQTWRLFIEANVALFLGLVGLNLLLSTSPASNGGINPLSAHFSDSPIETVAWVLFLPLLETLVWQAFFIEGFTRFGASRWVPLLLSPSLFAVALHWQRGSSAMVGAFWFWLVLGLVYASQCSRSFIRAVALTTAVHWMPLVFLLLAPLIAGGAQH